MVVFVNFELEVRKINTSSKSQKEGIKNDNLSIPKINDYSFIPFLNYVTILLLPIMAKPYSIRIDDKPFYIDYYYYQL